MNSLRTQINSVWNNESMARGSQMTDHLWERLFDSLIGRVSGPVRTHVRDRTKQKMWNERHEREEL